MIRHRDAHGLWDGGDAGEHPNDTVSVCHFPDCGRHRQPEGGRPRWLIESSTEALADWMGNTGFADGYTDVVAAQRADRERFDREAAEVRDTTERHPAVPPDRVATQLVADMLGYEEQGRVEWTGDTWRLPFRRYWYSGSFTPLTAGDLVARFEKVRRNGGGWKARCPAHRDRTPSLTIQRGDRWWLLHCFAGCPTASICAAVGLRVADLALEGGRQGATQSVH